MTATFSALELRPDGDVAIVKIKSATSKPVLKDIQTYLKKKTPPSVLTTYPNGSRRVTIIGYTKGKEAEISQQQLPPPYEASELYGSIILICHSIKSNWDTSVSDIELFSPVDYEVFYEKACSGELDETEDIDNDEEKDDEVIDEADEIEEEEDEEIDEDDLLGDEEMVGEEDELNDAHEVPEEVHHKVRVSRKAVKIDPQQLQFQYKSVLIPETTPSLEVVNSVPIRKNIYLTLHGLLGDHCSEEDILQLEMGIYNASLEESKRRMVPLTWDHKTFKWVYDMISKRTASNFHPDSYVANNELIERWKDGEFTLDMIGHWSPYDLKPSYWKDLKDQQFRRDKRILEGNLAMATDRFRCSRCQKKMCTYYELQTRSADEPMTIFISCVNCGKQWKQ
jgi:DNA-directed RNA polymerase subunit M/transcription elongation factor TFIIS